MSPTAWRREAASNDVMPLGLVLLGAVTATPTPLDVPGSTARALATLQWALDADDAEAFFVEPLRNDVLMAACVGPDRDALREREVFTPGTGYPGIVVASGRALLTRSAVDDRRFLRDTARHRGLRCYACVPVPGPCGPLGSIHLAWRSARAPLDLAHEWLECVAPVLGATVYAGLAASRERVRRVMNASGTDFSELCDKLVREFVSAVGARSGAIVLEDGLLRVTRNVSSQAQRGSSLHTCGPSRMCPYLAQGRAKVLAGTRTQWPSMCRRLPKEVCSPCCLPLLHTERVRGTVVLDYGDAAPIPLTRDLVVLLHMAQEGAAWLARVSEARARTAASSQPEFVARCFGSFELEIGGRRVGREAFTRKKALTLLQILLLKAGGPLDRSTLVELLWPGVDETNGANRLHGVVHSLRSVIETEGRPGWRYIKNDGELYWFDVNAPHRVDVFMFEKLLSDAAEADQAGRARDTVSLLEDALALYRGDLFADSLESEFCLPQRAELRERCFMGHKRLSKVLRGLGDLDRATYWLRRAVELDPLREDLQQDLIATLARAGRRKDAIEQYRACVRVLREELGTSPLPTTERLGRMLNA